MKELLTDDLWQAIRVWKEYKEFGLPHAKGLVGENWEITKLISSFQDEYNKLIPPLR